VKTHRPSILGLFVILAAQACAGAQIENPGSGGSGPGGGGGPQGGAGGGGGGGGTLVIDLDAAQPPAGPDTASSEPLPDLSGYQCDDAGSSCTLCQPVRIVSIGQPATYGSGSTDSTKAFEAFMNGNTNGTATMKMQTTKPTITADFLGQYDVVILQALYTTPYDQNQVWSFSSAEASALNDWVSNKGGAIIAMAGYFSDMPVEIGPLNQLMAPFGITYNSDDIFGQDYCPDNLCYCSLGSIPFNAWIDTPDCSAITVNHDGSPLGKVGVFRGRSLQCSGNGCNVIAKDPKTGNSIGIGKPVGQGRVFAWGDEWVTYTSQWGLDATSNQYDNATTYAQCTGHTPHTSYAVPQFWYNVFRWVANTSCLTIIVPPTAGSVPQIIY
jgi:hypothetical protein